MMTDAKAKLGKAAKAFLDFRDRVPSAAEEFDAALARSTSQRHMANYIHSLAQFARECGAENDVLEPARRLALALNDSGWGFSNPLFRHEDAIHELAWESWGGRKPPSRLWMEGRVVGCVHFMVGNGISIGRACSLAAGSFALMGHRGRKGGELSARIVRDWYDGLTSNSSVSAKREGWKDDTRIADLHRQNEAIETQIRLSKRMESEPDWDGWLISEMMTLAHSCAADPPSASLRLSPI